jgi:AraC-like DNA-binding protein
MATNANQHMVRSASIRGFKDLVAASGHDPLILVQMAGLTPACLVEDELRIPMAAIVRLLDTSAKLTGINDLGLRIAMQRSYSTIGPLGLLIREQPTVRDVINTLADYMWMQVEGLHIAVLETDESAILTVELLDLHGAQIRQTIELTLGVITGVVRRFIGRSWRPQMLTFRHRRPASVKLHTEFFGSTPLFEQDQNAIVLSLSDIEVALPQADPTAAKHIARYLEMVSGPRNQSFKDKVRQLIASALAQESSQMDQIARQLGMHPRSLHRRLKGEDTTFNVLLNEVRLEMMEAHSSLGTKSLTEISELLGFSSLSAFSRWKRSALANASSIGPSTKL